MFFVFNFLVFAFLTHSGINCSTQGNIRATNYVKKHEEISNSRGPVLLKGANHKTNKFYKDLKSNAFQNILTNEMLSLEHRYNLKDSSGIPISLSSKNHLVTPTLEIIQKWPMFKHINNVNDKRRDHNKNSDSKTTLLQNIGRYDDDYLDPLSKREMKSELKLEANKPEASYDVLNTHKVSGLKFDIHKPSKSDPSNNKIIGMRSLPNNEVKAKCTCRKLNPSSSCNSCAGNRNNKKRCTHSTPNVRSHECSRYGVAVTNHSCSQGQPFQSQPVLVTSNPYSFYPVYLPYSYFASEPPMIPYKVSYPQPNLLSDLKIPRKLKHKWHKLTSRLEDDLYYEDNDSRERKPYDESEYYQESKKGSTQVEIVYDVNQDALIKEIIKDLKYHNNKDMVKECYCDSSSSSFRVNIIVLLLTLSSFALLL